MAALLQAGPECAPRFATQRTDRRTLGPAVARFAEFMGTPLMPWQRSVVDVAFEVDDEGHLVYREVDLTVPRQSGKTTLLLAVAVHRAYASSQFGKRNRMVYTAQTRNDARKKFFEDFIEGGLDTASRLRGKYRVSKQPGDEHVKFENGSRLGIESTTEKAGHGGTLDLAFIDEAFSHTDDRVEQAFNPAMITRPQPQLWVNSTAGWLGASPYLWAKVEAGRKRAEAGLTSDIAFFEWAADPDADPEDPATWWSCMPALGHTITEASVRRSMESMKAGIEGLNGFRRAFLNQWVPKHAPSSRVISPEAWSAREDRHSQPTGRLAFALDVTPDRDRAAIAVAGLTEAGETHVEVVDDRPGTSWLLDRVVELDTRHGGPEWLVDGRGPAMSLVPDLEGKGIRVRHLSAGENAQACGRFYDLATQGGLRHLGQPEVDRALAVATKQKLGDAWYWSRRTADPICALVAVTMAAYGLAGERERPKVVVHGLSSPRTSPPVLVTRNGVRLVRRG